MAGLPDTAAAIPCDTGPLCGGTPVSAQPSPSQPPPSLRAQADSIMHLNYKAFIRAKRSPTRNPRFNWDYNGHCDPPTPDDWADLFRQPCELHDFGYANYGPNPPGGLRLSKPKTRSDKPAEDIRTWIDGRFRTEMLRLCDDKYSAWWRDLNKRACRTEAWAMFFAVREGNDDWFPEGAPAVPVATAPTPPTTAPATPTARAFPVLRDIGVYADANVLRGLSVIKAGTQVQVLCWTTGQRIANYDVWDRIKWGDGIAYVHDKWVDMGGRFPQAMGIPAC